MDLSSIVYGMVAPDLTVAPRPNTHIDEAAELARPKPVPLREPRIITKEKRLSVDEARPSSPGHHPAYGAEADESAANAKRKHESFLLSGSVFLVTNNGKTLNLPIPSDSKRDPLNWSKWRTGGAMLALAWFSIVTLTAVQATSVMINGIAAEFGDEITGPKTPENLITWPTMFMGIGALIWVPLSLALGRRPVFLLAALLSFFATIAAGYARSINELLVCVCLLGMGEGFALTSAFLMVIDMTFIAQRPKAIAGFWSVAGCIGVCALSLVPWFSNHGHDWRLFYRKWSPMTGFALVLVYFLYPETYFKRPTVAFDGLILLQTATEKLTIYEDLEADSDLYKDLPKYPFDNDSKKPLLHRLGLARSPFGSFVSMGRCYAQIVFCFVNPLIFWILIASAFNFAGMTFIGATYARVLIQPPYSLPSSVIIHVNNASGIGSLLGYPLGGLLVDKLTKRLVKRNGGVLEAEHYLIAYILPVLAGSASTLIYGLAIHYQWPFAVYCLSYGINGLSWVSLSIANTMWVTEAFPRWAAPALVVVGGGCYLSSFSMGFVLVPWIVAHDFLLVGIELTILQIVCGLIVVPIAFWGKNARQRIHGRWAAERSGALRPL